MEQVAKGEALCTDSMLSKHAGLNVDLIDALVLTAVLFLRFF